MKEIPSGKLGPVFHPDGSITLLEVHEKVEIGERISYVARNYYGQDHHLNLGTGTVIGVSGDTVTIDNIETREVPDIKEVPLPHWRPTHEQIAELAYHLYWCNGGGWTTQAEADDNWYEAEGLLRARHDG